MALIGPDSKLRDLPQSVSPTQEMFLDGIRYSIEMAEIAYRRLYDHLVAISQRPDLDATGRFPDLFLDAFSVVDSAHRLQALIRGTKGMKSKTPEVQILLRALIPTEGLRNGVQHLSTEIPKLANSPNPAWGSLAWVHIGQDSEVTSFMAIPGAIRDTGGQVANPLGRTLRAPVDIITLWAYRNAVELSAVFDAISGFVPWLEGWLEENFPGGGLGSDILASMSFGVASPNPPSK
jgi:hypothetical protein